MASTPHRIQPGSFLTLHYRLAGPEGDIINTFDDGFVIQYQLNGVQHSGHTGALWICIVGRVRDGKLTRIDEYMDSGKFDAWAGRTPKALKGEVQ